MMRFAHPPILLWMSKELKISLLSEVFTIPFGLRRGAVRVRTAIRRLGPTFEKIIAEGVKGAAIVVDSGVVADIGSLEAIACPRAIDAEGDVDIRIGRISHDPDP